MPENRSPRVILSLDPMASRHASLRSWRAQYRNGKHVSEVIVAAGNTNEPGASVTGSFWAVRNSNPIPLVSALLGTFADDITGLCIQLRIADSIPFAGELMGRFLGWRENAGMGTVPFSPAPPGDWWVADCVADVGAFVLGINELESTAAIVPKDWATAKALAGGFLGLWISIAGSIAKDGAAGATPPSNQT